MTYDEYLKSEHWNQRRQRALQLAAHQCEFIQKADLRYGTGRRCPSRYDLQVHHLNYRRLGCERDFDLKVFCRKHHAAWHIMEKKCVNCGCSVITSSHDAVKIFYDLGEDLPTVLWFLHYHVNDTCQDCHQIPFEPIDPMDLEKERV
jgi:hypothetical protein